MNQLKMKQLLERFFIEDIGERDITASSLFPNEVKGEITLVAKEAGVFCGAQLLELGYQLLNPNTVVELYVSDGEKIEEGKELASISGSVSTLLSGERVLLNLLQRMSGIATMTRQAVEALDSPHTRICDTRKTTPGLRMLEKYAVRCGGGFNHRYGLYDGVMIKDNHIEFAGSIQKAVAIVREKIGHMVKIEVETESKKQIQEAVEAGADVIMFDNQSAASIQSLVKLVPPGIVTEASGGIELLDLARYRHSGVDYISLGFLTHSVQALDISANVNIKGDL